MSIDEAISMEPVKEKLRNLREHMPDQQDVTYDFGAYLADRLHPKLVPKGFNVAVELVLWDLENGVNSVTKQPIINGAVGYPPVRYDILRTQVPEIAEAVCPEEFAKGVRECYERANAAMKAMQ